jgi:hypothetical protein
VRAPAQPALVISPSRGTTHTFPGRCPHQEERNVRFALKGTGVRTLVSTRVSKTGNWPSRRLTNDWRTGLCCGTYAPNPRLYACMPAHQAHLASASLVCKKRDHAAPAKPHAIEPIPIYRQTLKWCGFASLGGGNGRGVRCKPSKAPVRFGTGHFGASWGWGGGGKPFEVRTSASVHRSTIEHDHTLQRVHPIHLAWGSGGGWLANPACLNPVRGRTYRRFRRRLLLPSDVVDDDERTYIC